MTLVLPAGFGPPAATETVAQQQPPDSPGGQGEAFGKSSPVALVVMLLFFLAVVLLVRSMNKHLRRIPESFDPPEERPDTDTGTDGSTDK
ncbi:MAG: hypothetical protein GEV09_18155 [Pseudonocardiaceae bacterium]|nr:hypothetical protein [Pseudonocardiaceae bacterium]